MDQQRFNELQEHALIALTYIEYDQNPNRLIADDNKKMILDAYDKAAINEGSLLVLTALIAYEAYVLEMPIEERINQVREIVRDWLQPRTDDDQANE